jgi:hypothetical protein
MVLSGAQSFTDISVSGDGGGTFVASFYLQGHHCEASCPILHGALEGVNLVHLWMCDDGSCRGLLPPTVNFY